MPGLCWWGEQLGLLWLRLLVLPTAHHSPRRLNPALAAGVPGQTGTQTGTQIPSFLNKLGSESPPCAGSDGWFYPQHAAENTSLREIIHDGFLHPKDAK